MPQRSGFALTSEETNWKRRKKWKKQKTFATAETQHHKGKLGALAHVINHCETFILSNQRFPFLKTYPSKVRGEDRQMQHVCSYLLCDQSRWRRRSKLPPRADLGSAALPQADGLKYISSAKGVEGHKTAKPHLPWYTTRATPRKQTKERTFHEASIGVFDHVLLAKKMTDQKSKMKHLFLYRHNFLMHETRL